MNIKKKGREVNNISNTYLSIILKRKSENKRDNIIRSKIDSIVCIYL